MASRDLYIGLMSGTSLDGVDAVLADFSNPQFSTLAHAHVGFDPGLRDALLALSTKGEDEIDRAGRLGRVLAERYAHAVERVLDKSGVAAREIRASGCHGERRYSRALWVANRRLARRPC